MNNSLVFKNETLSEFFTQRSFFFFA